MRVNNDTEVAKANEEEPQYSKSSDTRAPRHEQDHNIAHTQITRNTIRPTYLALAPLHSVGVDELAGGHLLVSVLAIVVLQVLLVRARRQHRRSPLAVPVTWKMQKTDTQI